VVWQPHALQFVSWNTGKGRKKALVTHHGFRLCRRGMKRAAAGSRGRVMQDLRSSMQLAMPSSNQSARRGQHQDPPQRMTPVVGRRAAQQRIGPCWGLITRSRAPPERGSMGTPPQRAALYLQTRPSLETGLKRSLTRLCDCSCAGKIRLSCTFMKQGFSNARKYRSAPQRPAMWL
jgi:hypothetical protein